MGPFPHHAPRATITPDNPAGTDGFEFVEFAQSLDGVWWATREEIADHYAANHEAHMPHQLDAGGRET